MPREAEEEPWPFSHGQRVAVGAAHPALLPAAMDGDRQTQAASPSSSHVFLTLHQLQVGRGLALGLKFQVLERSAVYAAALCALECFSPFRAVLGQGELLWGVTGVSRLPEGCWPGAEVLLLAGDDLIFTEPQCKRVKCR